jgi:hypothetical protein
MVRSNQNRGDVIWNASPSRKGRPKTNGACHGDTLKFQVQEALEEIADLMAGQKRA